MSVLMVDVGGTNVKIMAAPDGEMRKFRSGSELTAQEMVGGVLSLSRDWEFDRVSIGFPGLLANGLPAREPLNIGAGWVGFNYSQAFARPVRLINDAAMQALGNYVSGRLLFLGLGTSTGAAIIVDDVVVPIEIGLIKLTRKIRLMDVLSKEALKRDGLEQWMAGVLESVELLQDVFYPDDTVIGGGNAKHVDPLPVGCRGVDNASAYIGAMRLWENADQFAAPCASSWRIHRNEAGS